MAITSYIFFSPFLLILPWTQVPINEPRVTLNLGDVRGSFMTTLRGRQISAFRGIPYVKPPIGNLRYKPPEKWTENWLMRPFDAREESSQCFQFSLFRTWVGQEDCLVVNVYTPEVPDDGSKSKKLPVMVYIHGGGFRLGSARSRRVGPRRIMDHDVVLVTLNYRLHVYGFLSTLSKELPGNYGLLDQVEALKWVQENINAFGGDPDKVTIFGDSAGGASVSFHLLSKLSTGLFSAAIIMSGHSFSWAYDYNPNPVAEGFIKTVNCQHENSTKIVHCLQSLPKEKLTTVLKNLADTYSIPFGPVLDGNFITDHPINILQKGEIVNKVPVMIGTADKEGILLYALMFGKLLPKYSDEIMSTVLAKILNIREDDNGRLGSALDLVKNRYFQSIDIEDRELVREKICDMISDAMMKIPAYYMLDFYVKSGMTPYLYSLDYATDHSIARPFGLKNLHGATHNDELFFLFGSPELFPAHFNKVNDEHEDKFLQLWINFAKYRNPTPGHPNDSFIKWEPVKEDDIKVYHLDNPIRFEKLMVDEGLIDFWIKDIPKSFEI